MRKRRISYQKLKRKKERSFLVKTKPKKKRVKIIIGKKRKVKIIARNVGGTDRAKARKEKIPVRFKKFHKSRDSFLIKKESLSPRSRKKEVISNDIPSQPLFKAKIKVVGIGGGGGSIVSEMGKSLKKATFLIADTDIRALKKKSGIKYFWFGQDLTHGLGTGINVELAKEAAIKAKDKIRTIFQDQDIIIFVASLGGGLGSGATQVFAEIAREMGGITFGIFTLPFKFEGKSKQRIAQNALKNLRKILNVSLVIPNERIFKIIDEKTPIVSAFSTVNKNLIKSLDSLIDLIYNPGIINIDFADLRTILKGRGNLAFLNTTEEGGKDRAQKTCNNIFKNPLLQNSRFGVDKILFNIAGSESLSMFEVEKISSHIAQLNPKAKIIFGISKNPKLKNKIKTTILMTGSALETEGEELAEEEPQKAQDGLIKKAKKHFQKTKTKTKKVEKSLFEKEGEKVTNLSDKRNPSLTPALETLIPTISVLDSFGSNKKNPSPSRPAIRRTGLDIKKEEELQEKERIAQEKEWEIPTFLRKIKFKQ